MKNSLDKLTIRNAPYGKAALVLSLKKKKKEMNGLPEYLKKFYNVKMTELIEEYKEQFKL